MLLSINVSVQSVMITIFLICCSVSMTDVKTRPIQYLSLRPLYLTRGRPFQYPSKLVKCTGSLDFQTKKCKEVYTNNFTMGYKEIPLADKWLPSSRGSSLFVMASSTNFIDPKVLLEILNLCCYSR